ncbi:hypothetical protein [Mesohalobacter halotolerans]|uniref:Lipocalin-like domain-containing protein n=1 Tax=Mesohalobacter halotolerans TaxID=1883405 RepID=A0A4U5TRJ2_9FLAO|nr:hypothetical protein [Mesohalobacter halotolerans]MBS3737432.1 hypothetical protein [Psychroflexus sp.]TKS56880.1 hypothetical protein FCN74_00190 [Mesohalobacter halotolerans]
MRTTQSSFLIIGCFSLLLLISCSSDDDSSPINISPDEVENTMQNGTWRITNFVDSGINETEDFTGYNFTFESSGILNASDGNNNFSGIWSVTNSNSNDDSPDDSDLDFNINFNFPQDFQDLSDDWDIISHSPNKIELTDVSGGNGETDFLTFEIN